MDRILVDTNVVLDLLAKRRSFYSEAQELFSMADRKQVRIFVSSLTFENTYYLLFRSLKMQRTKKVLRKFRVLVEVLPMDDKIIDLSLESEFRDFEDAIQYHTATENDLKILITRNLKDFRPSTIPVLTAKDYLATR